MRNFITFLHDTKTEGGELAGKTEGRAIWSRICRKGPLMMAVDPMMAGCSGGPERLMLREDGHEYVQTRREAMEG